jgi:lipoprotein-anchoring transpeptidase ErfK/SrfK
MLGKADPGHKSLFFGIAVLAALFVGPAAAETVAMASPEQLPEVQTAVAAAPSSLMARVDISDQTLSVYVDDRLEYVFPVSTARAGYLTPVGEFSAEWLSPRHRSRKYDNAPMPWAVFFHDGWAVHGTTDLRHLGRPASHGCVRLHPDNAKIFYSLVKDLGKQNTTIIVSR